MGRTSVKAEAGMLLGKDLGQGAKFEIPPDLDAEPVFTASRDVHHTLPCKNLMLVYSPGATDSKLTYGPTIYLSTMAFSFGLTESRLEGGCKSIMHSWKKTPREKI